MLRRLYTGTEARGFRLGGKEVCPGIGSGNRFALVVYIITLLDSHILSFHTASFHTTYPI